MDPQKKELAEILGNDFGKKIIRDLGIVGIEPEAQAGVIFDIASAVFERVIFEVYTALPQEVHSDLNSRLESGNVVSVKALLGQHIMNVDQFIQAEATKVYERMKATADKITLGEQ